MTSSQEGDSVARKGDFIAQSLILGAEAEANRIIAEARSKLGTQLENRKREAEREYNRRMEEKRNQLSKDRERAVAEAELQIRRDLLETKETLVAQVFESALKELESLTERSNYVRYVEGLIVEAGMAIGGGEIVAIVLRRDSNLKLDTDSLAKVVEERTGSRTTLTLEFTDKPTSSGVMVKTMDGKFVLDNRFEARLARLHRRLRKDVARLLYSEEPRG